MYSVLFQDYELVWQHLQCSQRLFFYFWKHMLLFKIETLAVYLWPNDLRVPIIWGQVQKNAGYSEQASQAGAEEMFLSAPWFKVHSSLTVTHATFAFNIHTTQHSLIVGLEEGKTKQKFSLSFNFLYILWFHANFSKVNNNLLFALETGYEHIPMYSFILLYCPYRHSGGWWIFPIELTCCFIPMP